MRNQKELEKKLQKNDRKQSVLYLFCCFLSLMLITAYTALMFSPTVQNILPEGGDSRKQMYAVFVLALVGCTAFTVYASTLFFRKKSRQLGILMALGASRRQLAPGLFREVLLLSCGASVGGILAGIPFVALLWNSFRVFLTDSKEMKLHIDYRCLFLPALFLVLVSACACCLAFIYLRRTDILDTISEEHRTEPVKEPGRWCGPLGIFLLLLGAVAGYGKDRLMIQCFHRYPPLWMELAYTPVFVGLYMIMLHTVVYGWTSRKRKSFKNMISRSMMKFQGRQTVNSLIVSALLIAGGSFAIFYLPMLSSGMLSGINERPYDYFFHYRADQSIPGKKDITAMADRYGVSLKDWRSVPYLTLGVDGTTQVDEPGGRFHIEYEPLLIEENFLSESSYRKITGTDTEVPAGACFLISEKDESIYKNPNVSLLTNMNTRKTFSVNFDGFLPYELLSGFYVLDDADYAAVSEGLSDEWQGKIDCFRAVPEDSYAFADEFFHTFVRSFDEECALPYFYSRVRKIVLEERGETYWGDTDKMSQISFERPDSSDFRQFWVYMPQILILDKNDFFDTFAVYLLVFLFIAIICYTAALVIGYTRCQTIVLNNRYVFDSLRRLGASPKWLFEELCRQCRPVFAVPSAVGMGGMYLLYLMLMYANDGKFTFREFTGMMLCVGVLIVIASLFFGVYTHTVHNLKHRLNIPENKTS